MNNSVIGKQYFKDHIFIDCLPKGFLSGNTSIISLFLLLFDIIAISLYKTDTLITFVFTFIVISIINVFYLRVPQKLLNLVYVFIVGTGLVMIIINSINIPAFYGMTSAFSHGTDDAFYYIQSTLGTNNEVAELLPTIRYDAYDPSRIRFYSMLLHYWGIILKPLVNVYPLDMLFMNIGFCVFYCLESMMFCYNVTSEQKYVRNLFPILLFCPFMFSNGMILVRDILVAFCFVTACNRLLKWELLHLIIPIGLLVLLRPAAILEFIVMAWFLILLSDHFEISNKTRRHITFWLTGIIVVVIVAINNMPLITRYISQLSGGIRTNVMDALNTDGTLYTFYKLPFLLRVPAMSFYFFIMPLFSIKAFVYDGVFLIRDGYYAIFGLMNLILLPRFINATLFSCFHDEDKRMRYICLLFIVMMVFISQLSTVTRHKTGFIFLYYTCAVYGKDHYTKYSKIIGYVVAVVLSVYYLKGFFA